MGETIKTCAVCGKEHPARALELSFKRPDIIAEMTDEERAERCRNNDDIYIVEDEGRYFIRGLVALPVPENDDNYCIGIWAEVEKEVFQRIWDLWDDENQYMEPPMKGFLANDIPSHSNTNGLKIQIKLSDPSTRPTFEVTDQSHLLYKEQKEGISAHRAHEYSDFIS